MLFSKKYNIDLTNRTRNCQKRKRLTEISLIFEFFVGMKHSVRTVFPAYSGKRVIYHSDKKTPARQKQIFNDCNRLIQLIAIG